MNITVMFPSLHPSVRWFTQRPCLLLLRKRALATVHPSSGQWGVGWAGWELSSQPFMNVNEQINPINYPCSKSHCLFPGKHAHPGRPPPHPCTLNLNNITPGADSCCGMQEPRRDRCDEDERIPFLREWNKLFKTNNHALSQADTHLTVGLKDETLMWLLGNEWFP